ncbi:uncharacterized protein [Haliotis asinina]|uniref:uncharacterized protein n=1 Tax=Haliotis asinina TaxID=109174 RepID=UPI003532099E
MTLGQQLWGKWRTDICILLCCYSVVDATNNVAAGKPVYYSTSYPSYSQPHYAVDGNTNSDWYQGSCFGTDHNDRGPWWMVDLLRTYTIGNITIYNRADDYWERLHDVTVEVFSVNPVRCPTATVVECKELPGQLAPVTHITCDQEVVGRFVRIRKETVDDYDTMMFCEIEITGIALHSACGHRLFPAIIGRRLQQATLAGNSVFANSRSECVKSCYVSEGCVGGNFRKEGNTCEMISSPSSSESVVSDSQWEYFGSDLC